MTCKDCLHYDVCAYHDTAFHCFLSKENICKCFKDKRRFVELSNSLAYAPTILERIELIMSARIMGAEELAEKIKADLNNPNISDYIDRFLKEIKTEYE